MWIWFTSADPVSRSITESAAYSGLEGYLHRLVRRAQLALPDGMGRPNRHSRELRLFRSLVFRKGLRRVRERAIKAVSVRIRALGLAGDEVFPVQ